MKHMINVLFVCQLSEI